MRLLLILAAALMFAGAAPPAAPARGACPAEDDPAWNWVRCGNGQRGIVTMWGTPKVVSCGEMRWLYRHHDIDPREPWIVGDYSCGRRR